jgi:glycosyltransferase involved in cell wall biosynthesis
MGGPFVGYIPYAPGAESMEAGWVAEAFGVEVLLMAGAPCLNVGPPAPPPMLGDIEATLGASRRFGSLIVEGIGGFLWAALLRRTGYEGRLTLIPYVNPRRWHDVACLALYQAVANPDDRILIGSRPSARVLAALGVAAEVGEPYGVDSKLFRPPSTAARKSPAARRVLFAGRVQADKNLPGLTRAVGRAARMVPELELIIASHVIDEGELAAALAVSPRPGTIRLARSPSRHGLATLYAGADVVATAATSVFETFGRAPAEALCCGTPAVAPCYDGFTEVLDQRGARLAAVTSRGRAPQVDETALSEALVETLDQPLSRAEIAATAHGRLSRRKTIERLRHVVDPQPRPASDPPPPADLVLPGAWVRALEGADAVTPSAALNWLWGHDDRGALAGHDAAFADAVRRALVVPLPVPRREPAPCP